MLMKHKRRVANVVCILWQFPWTNYICAKFFTNIRYLRYWGSLHVPGDISFICTSSRSFSVALLWFHGTYSPPPPAPRPVKVQLLIWFFVTKKITKPYRKKGSMSSCPGSLQMHGIVVCLCTLVDMLRRITNQSYSSCNVFPCPCLHSCPCPVSMPRHGVHVHVCVHDRVCVYVCDLMFISILMFMFMFIYIHVHGYICPCSHPY
jgi:hypothetical protein